MKTIIRALSLILVLGAQVFAQRFTATTPDAFQTGFSSAHNDTGYLVSGQIAALGEQNSSYANVMLVSGRDTLVSSGDGERRSSYKVVNSHGKDLGNIYPTSLSAKPYSFTNSAGETVYDNKIRSVAVLDSLSDNKKAAIVLFASLKRLMITEIRINKSNLAEYTILATVEMQNAASQADGNYFLPGSSRRLTLMGTSLEGNDKVYHIATGNPLYKSGTNAKSGRVDFFSIRGNKWTVTQPNTKGIASGEGFLFMQNTSFGSDLASVGDLDGNGYNELAVFAPASEQFPTGAIYVFFMDNPYTPSSRTPTIITGSSMPWSENSRLNPQRCNGMSFTTWKNEPHLLLSCDTGTIYHRTAFIKDIILDSNGNIANTSIFSATEQTSTTYLDFYTNSNPVSIKNHINGELAVALAIQGPCNSTCNRSSIYVYSVADADASKNFPIEVGKREIIANIDSLFYKSGTVGYSSKTLAGLADCYVQNTSELVCEAGEEAQGSWSMVELSSRSGCDPYRACKRKDSIYIYARANSETANTALRIPKNIVIKAQNEIFAIEKINSLTYFRNPKNLNTSFSWNSAGLRLSAAFSNATEQLSIIPLSQREGIDTLVFSLSISSATDNYPVRLHIVDTAKIFTGPLQDTIWNTAQKRYFALPRSNTYDITQDSLGVYAEITGDYLHILKVDVADISIAYTENAEIKYRKITLMPEPKKQLPNSDAKHPDSGSSSDDASFIAVASSGQSLSAMQVKGGVQISGITGEFELVAYNLRGEELQRVRAHGSGFVSLKHGGAQIVRIRAGSQRVHFLHSNL